VSDVTDVDSLVDLICAGSRERLDLIEVFDEIDSTNSYLLAEIPPAPGRFRVAFANHQTAGRGRLGRQWRSPPGSGICLSMSYTFERKPKNLACLTLSIGVGLAQALQQMGAKGIELKWPNDLIVNRRKLGGILTEIHPSKSDCVTVVTGLGLNVELTGVNSSGSHPDLVEAADLADCFSVLPSRQVVSSCLVDALFSTQNEFGKKGFSAFAEAWRGFDWLRGQKISVQQTGGLSTGICDGIDNDGALLLETSLGRERIVSGSVSFAARHSGN
jgi:BirA family biotin operon repressor/biotin-[acetyl-CoA-carboxylase] ligase